MLCLFELRIQVLTWLSVETPNPNDNNDNNMQVKRYLSLEMIVVGGGDDGLPINFIVTMSMVDSASNLCQYQQTES